MVWAGAVGTQLAKRRVVELLKKAGAVSRENMKTPQEAGINDRLATWLGPLVISGQIVEVTDKNGVKHYYVKCKDEKHC